MLRIPLAPFAITLLLGLCVCLPASAYTVVRGQIVDTRNRPVPLHGLNWFGFETDTLAPHGLWARNWKEQLDQMQVLGVNALRVPLCPDAIHGGKTKGVDAKLNPDLADLDSAQLLDVFVRELDRRGMYVLLDHHRPDCSGQSELWYTDQYPESAWTADLVTLAERFRDVPHVIGIDIKNEPRGRATWGTGDNGTDWNKAAERAAKAVVARAPQWLIFVQGIEKNPQCSSPDPHFWGENLEPFACAPLDIPPDRLVLAPHTYGPDVFAQPFFDDPTFPANMPAIWERNFGQFLKQGYAVILGEFGGRYGEGGNPKDRIWQDMLVQYLVERRVNSAFYWSWNPNSKDTGGLLQDDWKTIRPDKLALLQRLWSGKGAPSNSVAHRAPAATVGAVIVQASPGNKPATAAGKSSTVNSFTRNIVSDWGTGYCADVTVRNDTSGTQRWAVTVPLQGHITQSWNAIFSGDSGATVLATGVGWNADLAAGANTHFGYCVLRDAAPSPPVGDKAALLDSNDRNTTVIQSKLVIDSRWDRGYCAHVVVSNHSSSTQVWRVRVPITGRVQNLWKARYSVSAGQLVAEGEDYNRELKAGTETDFGFCSMTR